ncbi:MAG TPA: pilin [Candidatus Paceibacterota bacterium]|nr:pilin [Candidatus Paceibacterota bacterium]
MRRYAPALIAAASGVLLLAPLLAHAAGIPFWGPIIPTAENLCPGNWALLITVINNVIELALTIAIIFFAPLMIAYAGFLYLTSGASPGNRSQANSILTNTIVGITVALAAWIIVDAVMAALYNPNAGAGAWYSIVSSGGGSACLPIQSALNSATLPNGQSAGVTGVGPGGTQLTGGTGACDPAALQQADPGISQQEAQILACIAKPESSCGTDTGGATTPGGQSTSASGPFQIVFGAGNDSCHNLNVPQCEALNGGQPLNCYQHFSGGKAKPNDPMAQSCIAAANNLSCATAAADCLVQADHGYSAWTADPRSSAQKACITGG